MTADGTNYVLTINNKTQLLTNFATINNTHFGYDTTLNKAQ